MAIYQQQQNKHYVKKFNTLTTKFNTMSNKINTYQKISNIFICRGTLNYFKIFK